MIDENSTIVVDGVFFQLNNSGIARLWAEILNRWQDSALAPRLVVLDRGGLPDLKRLRVIPCPRLDYDNWEADHAVVQDICDAVGARLFLSTYYTRPLHTPSLLMMYDMIPEHLGFASAHPMFDQKRDAIAHASAFGAISQNTLSDLHRFFPETTAKPACVVLPGVNAAFSPPSLAERQDFHERIVAPHLGGRPFFFFVGNPIFYKNARLLFRAFEAMPPQLLSSVALLCTYPDEELGAFRTLPGLKVHSARLSDTDLRLAYGSAVALVYPSLYEGFGLPAVEAMACGCPVVCSNTSSLPEVVGDAALMIDPREAAQLRDALLALRDPALRRELQTRGLKRAAFFSWDRMAAEWARFTAEMTAT